MISVEPSCRKEGIRVPLTRHSVFWLILLAISLVTTPPESRYGFRGPVGAANASLKKGSWRSRVSHTRDQRRQNLGSPVPGADLSAHQAELAQQFPQQREAFDSARKGGSVTYLPVRAANDDCQKQGSLMASC
jgi:hypothetical protein